MTPKICTSFRLTPLASRLLASIAEREGLNKTDVIEMLLRRRAEKLKIHIQEKPNA